MHLNGEAPAGALPSVESRAEVRKLYFYLGHSSPSTLQILEGKKIAALIAQKKTITKQTNSLSHNVGHIVKTKPPFGECYTCFGCETKTGVARILVIFPDRSMFSVISRKVSARAFH